MVKLLVEGQEDGNYLNVTTYNLNIPHKNFLNRTQLLTFLFSRREYSVIKDKLNVTSQLLQKQ